MARECISLIHSPHCVWVYLDAKLLLKYKNNYLPKKIPPRNMSTRYSISCTVIQLFCSDTHNTAHSLRPPQLHHVAQATTVASLLYASPAWWGFASVEDRSRLERLLGRLR